MTGKLLCTTVGIVSVLFAGECLLAHHSFSSEFNPNKVLTINGTVSDVSWTNPHATIRIAVRDANGRAELWTVHGDSLVTLEKNGWNPRTLVAGQPIAVCGYEALNGKREMSGEQVGLANGATLLFSTTDVKSCLKAPPTRQTETRRTTPPVTNPAGTMTNPIAPITNPIAPMGNPVGPVVSPTAR